MAAILVLTTVGTEQEANQLADGCLARQSEHAVGRQLVESPVEDFRNLPGTTIWPSGA